MRILQIIPSLEIGGAEAVVDTLSRKLALEGHEVSILTEYPVREGSKSSHLTYFSMSASSEHSRLDGFFNLFVWPIRNRKLLRDFQIIHCHLTRGMLIGLLLTCKPRRSMPRVVGTCHSVGGNISNSRILFEKICANKFDAFVLMARTNNWNNFSKRNNKIVFIPNGIDPINVGINDQDDKRDVFVIGTLSRLTFDRKPWLFVHLFKKIQEINPSIRFIIGGDGPLKFDLMSIAEKEGLSNIFWAGQINKKIDFFNELDLYITLTVGDISGIAGLEAISAGLPVFGIQISEDFFSENNSFILSLNNLETLASTICDVVNNSEKIAMVKENQKNIFDNNYHSSKMLRRYEELYRNLIGEE
jgi:glycosyltransferase involved in cell wall biosynthesis